MSDINKKPWLRLGFLTLIVTISVSFLTYYTYDGVSDDGFQVAFNDSYGVFALNIPEKMSFASEPVPLTDPEVLERMDRELLVNTYWQSQTLLFIKRTHRDFQIIEPILEKYGIPEDFKYLAVIESGLVNVVSPAGASGYWQLLSGTAEDYGLEVNRVIDERYHLEKSTEAACKYLLESYKQFGSWTLAAASYNMGRDGLAKQLERQGGKSYYDLILNSETGRYVFRILAVKKILDNPEAHGFHFREKDLYSVVPCRELKVDTAIEDLAAFARNEGINYRILKYHNPWLRLEYLPENNGKSYTINIPLDGHFELSPEIDQEIKEYSEPAIDSSQSETKVEDPG